jgi:hypothetical protein
MAKMGRPPHEPTDETRLQVKTLAAFGIRHPDIAAKLGITDDTLVKYYREELQSGVTEANATIAKSLFEKAKSGDTASMIFWLKTRARWKEVHTIENVYPDGAPPTKIEIVAPSDNSKG